MALPTSAFVLRRPTAPRAGVTVECYPSTVRGLSVELQVATANSTLSSKWNSVAILPPTSAAAMRFTLRGLESTKSMFIRARHPAQPGYSAGPYTPVISAKPKLAPDIQRPMLPQLTYKGNMEIPSGSDAYLSSAKTVKVGTQVTTGLITKTVRINYGEFVPFSTANSWVYFTNLGLTCNSITVAAQLVAPLLLPPGVQLANVRARMCRVTTAAPAQAKVEFIRVADGADTTAAPTATIFKTLTHGTKGYKTLTTASTQIINSSQSFNVLVTLRSTVLNGSRVAWVEVDYKTGTYTKTI